MFNQPIILSQHQLLIGCAFALPAFLEPGAKLKAPLSQKVDETRLNPTSCSRLREDLCIAMPIMTVRNEPSHVNVLLTSLPDFESMLEKA
jgi:hypothetical protein